MANIDTRGHIVRVNDKDMGDLESLGSIKMKRNVKEYKAINTGNIFNAVGDPTVDPISMSVIYDPANSTGAGELKSAFISGDPVKFEVELSDKGDDNGTTFTWSEVVVSDWEINQEEDGKVIASFTASLNGMPTITEAA